MNPAPLGLIAELTHRCPLRCLYCSNPLELTARANELADADWLRVIDEAAEMGVLQIYFTGGEPCLRPFLPCLIEHARERGLYVNVITSGVGLSEGHAAAKPDHIQLSFQDIDRDGAKRIAGTDALDKKKTAAELIRRSGAAFTANLVVHRENLPRLKQMIDFAVELGAGKIEVAHVQFSGWALRNIGALLPTEDQVRESRDVILAARESLRGRCVIEYVLPDYFAKFPKACMNGWGRNMVLIDPAGRALPCHSAASIPGFEIPSIRSEPLSKIWRESALFNAFRGTDWMPEPCRSCDRREKDFGGCRCQALAHTGDVRAADPVCHLSPHREKIDAVLASREVFSIRRPRRIPTTP